VFVYLLLLSAQSLWRFYFTENGVLGLAEKRCTCSQHYLLYEPAAAAAATILLVVTDCTDKH